VSCVSGLYSKQGFTVWSASPPARPFRVVDKTDDVAAAEQELAVVPEPEGPGAIAGYTVLHEGGRPARAIAVIDLAGGGRTTAASTDPELMAALLAREGVGAGVLVRGDEFGLLPGWIEQGPR